MKKGQRPTQCLQNQMLHNSPKAADIGFRHYGRFSTHDMQSRALTGEPALSIAPLATTVGRDGSPRAEDLGSSALSQKSASHHAALFGSTGLKLGAWASAVASSVAPAALELLSRRQAAARLASGDVAVPSAI